MLRSTLRSTQKNKNNNVESSSLVGEDKIHRDDVVVGGGTSSSLSMSCTSSGFLSLTSKPSSYTMPLAPNNARPKNSDLLEGLTINKLNFTTLGLFGRDKEMSMLNECLNDLSSGVVDRQLILISGFSGTGKTTLANTLQKPTQKINGLFAQGKFDLNTRHEPYGGIILASTQICNHILSFARTKTTEDNNPGGALRENICLRIQQELGLEFLSLLVHFIPALSELASITKEDAKEEVSTAGFASNNRGQQAPSSSLSSEQAKNRFVFAFQQFLRIIVSEQFAPLIFVLDDLQWADGSSLDLIDALVSDPKTCKIMIIGIYRSNEVNQTHIFHRYIDSVREKSSNNSREQQRSSSSTFQFTELSIGNLDVGSVDKIIAGLLSMETSERTRQLAEVCYEKTQGNIFFLLHFLSVLNTRKLLLYNFGLSEWIWDVCEIKEKMSVSDNVVDLLQGKILDLGYSPNLISMLKIAACLGSTFQEKAVTLVMEHLPAAGAAATGEPLSSPPLILADGNNSCSTMDDIARNGLATLEQQGFIQELHHRSHSLLPSSVSSSRTFMWTHDKIHETANSLVTNREEWSSFGYCVGRILYKHLGPKELDQSIFVVANLLNQWLVGVAAAAAAAAKTEKKNRIHHDDDDDGAAAESTTTDEEERFKVAALNYQASHKAFSLAAFESAASYAAFGIDLLLPLENRWMTTATTTATTMNHYKLSLGLYSIGAQSEGYLGNYDTMERYCKEVSSLPNAPLEDKLSVYHTLIETSLARGRPSEAADLILGILSQYGCHFPKNPAVVALHVFTKVMQVKGNAKSQTVDELRELKDPRKLEALKLLDKLSNCWYMMQDSRLVLAPICVLNWTMRYGFSDYSSIAFSSAAMVLTGVLDDLQGGSAVANHALKLLEMAPTARTRARTFFIVYGFVLPWTMPLVQAQKPLLIAYDAGLQCGDAETSTWAVNVWLLQRFISGTSLEPLEMDYRLYAQQMKSLGRQQQYHTTSYTRQILLNLMGRNGDRVFELFGDGYSEEENRVAKQDPFHAPSFALYEGILQTYFGDHVRHADNTIRWGHDYFQKAYACSPIIAYDQCLKGVSCFVAATVTKKRKYIRMAEKVRSKIKRWRENGNPNVKQYESLLDAESDRCRRRGGSGKNKKEEDAVIVRNYEDAILVAARAGFQPIAAYASERLGDFFVEATMMTKGKEEERLEDACYRINQSIRFWREYGAAAKVKHLETKYEHLIRQDK